MDRSEVYLEILAGVELTVGHLDLNPGSVEPPDQLNNLFLPIGVVKDKLPLLPDFLLHGPYSCVIGVAAQFYFSFQNGAVGDGEGGLYLFIG